MRWLGFVMLLWATGCAALADNNPAPRCETASDCPDALACYRNFCVEDRESLDRDAGDESLDGATGAVSGPNLRSREDAGSARDAGVTAAALDAASNVEAAPAAPAAAPATPVATAEPAAATPSPATVTPAAPGTPPMPASAAPRWPWTVDQLKNVPPHLLSCLGSCTILGKKECEGCVAEKERAQRSGSSDACDTNDQDDEDDEGARSRRSSCGKAR